MATADCPTTPPYVVSVRALCEFAARRGDLDRRVGPASSLELGQEGHRLITARRDPSRRAEVWLAWRTGALLVRGRADGLDEAAGVLEEVKTHRGPLERVPANQRLLHRAQARVYAAMACRQLGLASLTVRLVYLDVDTGQETLSDETCEAQDLWDGLTALAERFVAWARSELAHRTSREDALRALPFPYEVFRTGQRTLAEQVYRATTGQRALMAQACTGIGKTIGTVYPMLKAVPSAGLDKVFFLTAKRSGQQAPADVLAALGAGTARLPLRVVRLVAREAACERPGKACHGESCDLARGFYDRLPAAREACVSAPLRDTGDLRRAAAAHGVCPYYLSQEMVRWADVVIADYNHFFDGRALLAALAAANDWKVGLLVDEAHNLVERARRMYSAELALATLDAALAVTSGRVAAALRALKRSWHVALAPATTAPTPKAPTTTTTTTTTTATAAPGPWMAPLQQACQVIEQELAAGLRASNAAVEVAPESDPLLAAWFAMRGFLRLADAFDTHSLFEATGDAADGGGPSLRIRNVVPAPFLSPRFAQARTAVLFSGTLSPGRFEKDLLGLPKDTAFIDVDAPFRASQLSVRHARISTRYQDRHRSIGPIGRLIADQFDAARGNYLAFFSSFAYLDAVHDAFARHHAAIPVWRQRRTMSVADREAFIDRLRPGGEGVAFAVLGGSFAEGIDLPGGSLAGVFIATLGLPAVEAGNEAVRQRLEATFGSGYDYAYLVPGLRKVVQAAGRLVRSPTDRGVVHLIDPRYGRPEVQALLPGWWPPMQAA